MDYKVHKFHIELPEKGGCTIALIGASRSGKTTLMKYLYNEFFTKYITTLFTLNSQADIYKDFSKKVLICNEYYPEIVKEAYTINHTLKNKFNFLFIFDDIIGPAIKNDQQIQKLLSIYRNADVSTIQSVQDPTLMNRVGRGNVNYICLFKQNSDTETEQRVKAYLRSYLPPKMTMNQKIQLYNELVADHHFIFIDNLNNKIMRSKLQLPGDPDPTLAKAKDLPLEVKSKSRKMDKEPIKSLVLDC